MNDSAARAKAALRQAMIDKVPTCIAGVDAVLRGGLPKGRLTLIVGGPGSGKTILALEFLYRNALSGNPGIFVAFEERADAIRTNAESLGWDLSAVEREGKLFLFQANVDPRTIIAGEFDFRPLLAVIEGQARAMGAKNIVFDAIDVPLRLYANPARERAELFALNDWLAERGMTSVMTAKTGEVISTRYEFLDYMANTVITLDQRIEKQTSTRRMRVIKYRGSSYDRNEYPYVIGTQGILLLPITSARLAHRAFGARVSTGQPQLDQMLEGGLFTGSCVFIAGTTGTGKTTLATTIAKAAAERGEKVIYFSFEESAEALVKTTLSAGIDLRPALDSGKLEIHSVLPESRGAEEHLIEFVQMIDRFEPVHVILDAASATERFRTESSAFDFLVRLINACKDKGRTCIFTNQLSGVESTETVTGLGISSIVDAVILLQRVGSNGEFTRAITVLKARGSGHSNQSREFLITDHGIEIPDAYLGESGLVRGVARQVQEAKDALDWRRLERHLHAKEAEIAQLRSSLEAQASEFRARIELAEADLDSMRLERDLRQRGREQRARMRGGDGSGDRP